MLGIGTDDATHPLPFAVPSDDEAAILTNRCAGRTNFHGAGGVGSGEATPRPSDVDAVGEGDADPAAAGEWGENR